MQLFFKLSAVILGLTSLTAVAAADYYLISPLSAVKGVVPPVIEPPPESGPSDPPESGPSDPEPDPQEPEPSAPEPTPPSYLASTSVSSVNFQAIYVASSAGQNITITNTGTGTLTLPSNVGTVAAPFSVSDTCSTALGPGQSCTITVNYSPNQAGSHSGGLNLNLGQAGSKSIAVSGSANALAWVASSRYQYLAGDWDSYSTAQYEAEEEYVTIGVPAGLQVRSVVGVNTPSQLTIRLYSTNTIWIEPYPAISRQNRNIILRVTLSNGKVVDIPHITRAWLRVF